jgi:hypothetical protein
MQAIGRTGHSVRVQCLVCGAHKELDLADYAAAAEGRLGIRCSTCGEARRMGGDAPSPLSRWRSQVLRT